MLARADLGGQDPATVWREITDSNILLTPQDIQDIIAFLRLL